jgi:nucleoside-diphosphate-sugar epimerase
VRVLVTGHAGFIARNLVGAFGRLGHTVVDVASRTLVRNNKGEPCVHRNSEFAWWSYLVDERIDLVVHNAAVVGTDVVALSPEESTLSNVMGTHTICRAARKAKIPVCYMGTSVIYNTPKYQREPITERSEQLPGTFYGAQKLASEHIVMSTVPEWLIMRPLFAYGGVGDMNSLVAKGFYALHNDRTGVDMFLDPRKSKDYMHVEDFCDAVALACDRGLWCQDFNVSAEEPLETGHIVDLMSEVAGDDIGRRLVWRPETDYLGNHLLSSQKFRDATGWKPRLPFREGLRQSWRSICSGSGGYDPLQHLDSARARGTDLVDYFPKAK